jgi:hypothetical protein
MPRGLRSSESRAFAGESREAVTNAPRRRRRELLSQFNPEQRGAAGNISLMKKAPGLHERYSPNPELYSQLIF